MTSENLNIMKDECWGFIPARGGSKSIKLKNIHPFAGRPLMDYCALAAKAASSISRVICSTDSVAISENCKAIDIEVHNRPSELGGDQIRVTEVFSHFLLDMNEKEGGVAEYIAFLQPTSPFILPEQLDDCLELLKSSPHAGSVQTVVDCPHQQHAINQRVIVEGELRFAFADDQFTSYNKQLKQPHFLFGNVILVRSEAALEQNKVFAEPSLPLMIDYVFGLDADGPLEFPMGEFLLEKGFLELPFLSQAKTAE